MAVTETFYTQDVINELSDAVAKQMSNRLPKGLSRDYSKAQPSLGDFNITSPMVAALLENSGIHHSVHSLKTKTVTGLSLRTLGELLTQTMAKVAVSFLLIFKHVKTKPKYSHFA